MKQMQGIDPYEPCLCGSGEKYKFCCYQKVDKVFHNPHESIVYVMKNKKKISSCMHADCDCSGKIIKSHSIQNNRILSRLAVNGHVYSIMSDPDKPMGIDIKKCGKNDATTSTCFCLYHDTSIFREIELKNYEYTEEQNFLYAYRAFSKAYHDRLDEQAAQQCIFSARPNMCIQLGIIDRIRGTKASVQNNEEIRKYLNTALDEKRFCAIETVIISFDYEIQFATSYVCPMSYDLMGNEINDVWSQTDRMKNIFVNVFPENGRTYVLISWLDLDAEAFSGLKEQLESLKRNPDEKYLINTLNNMVACQSDNFAFSPTFIETWDEEEKKYFMCELEAILLGSEKIKNLGLEIEKKLARIPCRFNLFRVHE